MNIRENILLKQFSAYNIGGPARYFCEVENENDLQNALKFANDNHLQIFILGGGTNLLISDKGFNGLVVKLQTTSYKLQATQIEVGAGVSMQKLVMKTTNQGLAGLEQAGGLPGTVGGAIFGNAGCFGWEIKEIVHRIRAIKIQDTRYKIQIFTNDECGFSYRNSKFKREGNWVILSAVLKLERGEAEELRKKSREKIEYRKNRHPLEYPNIGSIFKSITEKEKIDNIIKHFSAEDEVNTKWQGKIPAGALIQNAGLQGKQIGGAQVSEKHANFIINKHNASAEDVKILIEEVKETIKKLFAIELEEEVRYVGF